MVKFILKRLFYIIVVLFIVSFFIFWLYRGMPGDPALLMMQGSEQDMTRIQWEEALAQLRMEMGLDRPLIVQFGIWISNSLQGNFGYSFITRVSVMDTVRVPMINTIIMNILNLILVFGITIPVGIRAAVKRGKAFDNGALFGSMIGFSIPTPILGIIFMVIFAVGLGWLPMTGMHSAIQPDFATEPWAFLWDRFRFMILPLATLTFIATAGLTRFVRSAMIDALSMDSIRTARAKGLKEKTIIYSHAFRNALLPVITVMTGWFISVFSGSMVVESVFNWNGMGNVYRTALDNNDIPILKALTTFYALIAFVGFLIMDLTYMIVDPRIRFD